MEAAVFPLSPPPPPVSLTMCRSPSHLATSPADQVATPNCVLTSTPGLVEVRRSIDEIAKNPLRTAEGPLLTPTLRIRRPSNRSCEGKPGCLRVTTTISFPRSASSARTRRICRSEPPSTGKKLEITRHTLPLRLSTKVLYVQRPCSNCCVNSSTHLEVQRLFSPSADTRCDSVCGF